MKDMKENPLPIVQMWWEGPDLHVITDDGRHTAYLGATVQSKSLSIEGENTLQISIQAPSLRVDAEDIIPPDLTEELKSAMDTLSRLSAGLRGIGGCDA